MARLSKNEMLKVIRSLRVLQQKNEITINGKKVSFAAIPSAHTRPAEAGSNGNRITRRKVRSVGPNPAPNRMSGCFSAKAGAIIKQQRQTEITVNGITMKSEPKNKA